MDNGDELPAFFPKNNDKEPNKEPNMETEQPESMPTAQDASIPIEGYDTPAFGPVGLVGKKAVTIDALTNDEKEELIIKLYREIKENAFEFDDVIGSDYVTEPVKGEIYKAKALDTICRYASNDGKYHKLDFHNSAFYLKIEDNLLLKTTALERSLYEENEKL